MFFAALLFVGGALAWRAADPASQAPAPIPVETPAPPETAAPPPETAAPPPEPRTSPSRRQVRAPVERAQAERVQAVSFVGRGGLRGVFFRAEDGLWIERSSAGAEAASYREEEARGPLEILLYDPARGVTARIDLRAQMIALKFPDETEFRTRYRVETVRRGGRNRPARASLEEGESEG